VGIGDEAAQEFGESAALIGGLVNAAMRDNAISIKTRIETCLFIKLPP
jgi:hypothetical protein